MSYPHPTTHSHWPASSVTMPSTTMQTRSGPMPTTNTTALATCAAPTASSTAPAPAMYPFATTSSSPQYLFHSSYPPSATPAPSPYGMPMPPTHLHAAPAYPHQVPLMHHPGHPFIQRYPSMPFHAHDQPANGPPSLPSSAAPPHMHAPPIPHGVPHAPHGMPQPHPQPHHHPHSHPHVMPPTHVHTQHGHIPQQSHLNSHCHMHPAHFAHAPHPDASIHPRAHSHPHAHATAYMPMHMSSAHALAPAVGVTGVSGLPTPIGAPPGAPAPSEREAFYAKLHTFREEIGEPIQRLPTLGFKELDLCVLYREVTKRNGIDSVIANKQWKEVAEALQLPSSCTDSGFRLRLHYKKYLEAFERKFFSPTPPRGASGKHAVKSQAHAHTQTQAQTLPQSQYHAQPQSQAHIHMSVQAPSRSDTLSKVPDSNAELTPVVVQSTAQSVLHEVKKGEVLPGRNDGKSVSVPGSCATSATAATVGGEVSAGSGASFEKNCRRRSSGGATWKKRTVVNDEERYKSARLAGCSNASANLSMITGSYPSSENAEDDDGRRSNDDEFAFNVKPTKTLNNISRKRSNSFCNNTGDDFNVSCKKRAKADKRNGGKGESNLSSDRNNAGTEGGYCRTQKRTRVCSDQGIDTCETGKGSEKAAASSQESENIGKVAKEIIENRETCKNDFGSGGNKHNSGTVDNNTLCKTTSCALPNGEVQTLLEFIQAVRRV